MLESEAKLRWCPFARVVSATLDGKDTIPPANRFTAPDKPDEVLLPKAAYCIGSVCMAWRWTDALTVPQKDRRGCCGLAGRP